MYSPMRRGAAAATLVVVTLAIGVQTSSAAPDDSVPSEPVVPGPSTLVENEFIPEDANLSDCISALPRPECGSKARGGWRQTVIFAVLASVLAIGGWRLIRTVRRRDRAGVEEVKRLDAERAANAAGEGSTGDRGQP